MSLASGIKLMFLVINQWNRMEGGGNYRVDEGGVSYSPHQCVFSVTPHTDACRWRTDGMVTCAYIMNRFFFPCMIIFKDYYLFINFFFIEGFICRSPSLHNSSCRRKKRTWQMTVKGWDKTELLGGGGIFCEEKPFICQWCVVKVYDAAISHAVHCDWQAVKCFW